MASATPNSNFGGRALSNLYRSLPFKSHSRPSTSTTRPTVNLSPHDSVVISDRFPLTVGLSEQPKQDRSVPHQKWKAVWRLMRRASLLGGRHNKGPVVIKGPGKKGRGKNVVLTGDDESGIVLDDKDIGDEYYVSDPLGARVDFVQILPAEITAQILSYLDHRSLVSCEAVSCRWREAATNRHVWRDVFRTKHGPWESTPGKDWRTMFVVNKELHRRWNKAEMSYKYMSGHTDSVYCVQFDETKIITGSRDRTIRVWDIKTGECTRVLSANSVHSASTGPNSLVGPRGSSLAPQEFHTASVLCLQFDDKIMVTGSSDNTCIVWSLPSYTTIGRLSHHTAGVLDVCFSDEYIVTCSKDTTICVWDRYTLRLLRELHGNRGPVSAVAIREKQIASASGDALVKLWDIESGKCVREFKGHNRGLACVQFSDDASLIVSGGNDKEIRVWDAHTGECLRQLKGHTDLVRTLHLDTKNRRIISGSYDASVKVWNLDTGDMILDIKQFHSTWILAAKADYRRIVSTSRDSKALVLDFSTGMKGLEYLA